MLGADVVVVEQTRLFLRQHDHAAGPVGESLEHAPERTTLRLPEPAAGARCRNGEWSRRPGSPETANWSPARGAGMSARSKISCAATSPPRYGWRRCSADPMAPKTWHRRDSSVRTGLWAASTPSARSGPGCSASSSTSRRTACGRSSGICSCRARALRTDVANDAGSDAVLAEERRRALAHVLERLPERDRVMIVCRWFEEMSERGDRRHPCDPPGHGEVAFVASNDTASCRARRVGGRT